MRGFSSKATASTCGDHRNWSIGVTAVDLVATINKDAQIAGQRRRIARDRGDQRDVGARDLLGLILGAGARRIEHQPVELAEFLEAERAAKQIAALAGHALQPGGVTIRPVERRKRRRVAFGRIDFRLARQPEREGAAAGKQVGDLFGARQMCGDQPGHRLLGCLGRLQERARRNEDRDAVERHIGLAWLDDDLAVQRQPSETLDRREMRCRAARFLGQLPALRGGDVEARRRHGDGDAERARRGADQRGEFAQSV